MSDESKGGGLTIARKRELLKKKKPTSKSNEPSSSSPSSNRDTTLHGNDLFCLFGEVFFFFFFYDYVLINVYLSTFHVIGETKSTDESIALGTNSHLSSSISSRIVSLNFTVTPDTSFHPPSRPLNIDTELSRRANLAFNSCAGKPLVPSEDTHGALMVLEKFGLVVEIWNTEQPDPPYAHALVRSIMNGNFI
jgi:hypothetical protein